MRVCVYVSLGVLATLLLQCSLSDKVRLRLPASTIQQRRDNSTCNCVCGRYPIMAKIMGGRDTEMHEFPWIVMLLYGNRYHCGGTLITARHVMTAAHCLHGATKEHLKVIIGAHRRSDSANRAVVRRVVKMTPHEEYGTPRFDNDIAVLELDRPVWSSLAIRPACLPNSDDENYSGRSAVVAGWGRMAENKGYSDVLQKVKVPLLSTDECKQKGYLGNRITDSMFCAGFSEGKKDACQGDSGGPLHAKGPWNVTEVIGIVSWGRGCGRPNFPGVYTKVGRYIQWIDEQLDGECRCIRRLRKKIRTPKIGRVGSQGDGLEPAS